MHNKIKLTLFLFLTIPVYTTAQQKFTLQQCIQYAIQNNISIKQNEVQERIATLQYKQNKLSTIPSANFSNNDGYRFGKSPNPSTGILENQNFFSVGLNFQSSVEIFNWFAKRNAIMASQWELQATKAGTEKIKNDISLSIVNAYLQILLAREQENITAVQVQQSNLQVNMVQKQVKAGALPELNLLELEAQSARDSAAYLAAKGNTAQAKLIVKAYMNMDAAEPFDIEEQSAGDVPVEKIAELEPGKIYELTLLNLPQQKINTFKIKAAAAGVKAARGAMFPSISGYGSLGTNYGYYRVPLFQQLFSGYMSSGMVVSNGSGGYIDVQRPVYIKGTKNGYFTSETLGTQLNKNFGQSVGISISVPLFNGGSARANYEKAQLNIKEAELQKDIDDKTIRQDIYQAYNAAVVSSGKNNALIKSVNAAEKTFDFASKRYNLGMLTTLELMTAKNNLFTAKLELVLNQYNYIFKIKLLEFYKGQTLK